MIVVIVSIYNNISNGSDFLLPTIVYACLNLRTGNALIYTDFSFLGKTNLINFNTNLSNN